MSTRLCGMSSTGREWGRFVKGIEGQFNGEGLSLEITGGMLRKRHTGKNVELKVDRSTAP